MNQLPRVIQPPTGYLAIPRRPRRCAITGLNAETIRLHVIPRRENKGTPAFVGAVQCGRDVFIDYTSYRAWLTETGRGETLPDRNILAGAKSRSAPARSKTKTSFSREIAAVEHVPAGYLPLPAAGARCIVTGVTRQTMEDHMVPRRCNGFAPPFTKVVRVGLGYFFDRGAYREFLRREGLGQAKSPRRDYSPQELAAQIRHLVALILRTREATSGRRRKLEWRVRALVERLIEPKL